jgi:hypothetical protein
MTRNSDFGLCCGEAYKAPGLVGMDRLPNGMKPTAVAWVDPRGPAAYAARYATKVMQWQVFTFAI